jgi:hypothetical protein
MNTRRIGDWDLGLLPQRRLSQAICASAEEMDEFEMWCLFGIFREFGECY